MSAKILITGVANSGKTSLLKPLKDVLVFSRDGKPFSLPLPHVNIPDYENVNELLDIVMEKIMAYVKKNKQEPKTLVFDSVSRIFSDIENYSMKKHKGFQVWENINKEINSFVYALNDMINDGFNVIIIAHAVYDGDAKKYIETCKGSFAKTGGFLSTVDFAINIDVVGSKRIVSHKNNPLSRCLLEDVAEQEEIEVFNLQAYIEKVGAYSKEISNKFSL